MIDKNSIDIWAIPIHVNENKKQVDAYLQIPYFIWLLFALYLNVSIYILN